MPWYQIRFGLAEADFENFVVNQKLTKATAYDNGREIKIQF